MVMTGIWGNQVIDVSWSDFKLKIFNFAWNVASWDVADHVRMAAVKGLQKL